MQPVFVVSAKVICRQLQVEGSCIEGRKVDRAPGVMSWFFLMRDVAQQGLWFSSFVKKISDAQMNSLVIK